jgi:hypothetical protein
MLDEEDKIAALGEAFVSSQMFRKQKIRWRIREKFKQFFNCPSGPVPWQNERV